MGDLVSIIMPAYNAARYIDEAIRSVLVQTHPNWELLLVDDGSTDGTSELVDAYRDPRIRVFHKPNGGIGSARNLALANARGDFMCGLDADDVFPPDSLALRLAVFREHPATDIVDGRVVFMDGSLQRVQRVFEPTFVGAPFDALIALDTSCFMGFSWLIRWDARQTLRFDERITHGEDLLFYLLYAPGKRYRFTQGTVLIYRRTGTTAMSNLDGLERSYRHIARELERQGVASARQVGTFRRRTKRIMVVSFIRARRPLDALRCLLRFDRSG